MIAGSSYKFTMVSGAVTLLDYLSLSMTNYNAHREYPTSSVFPDV